MSVDELVFYLLGGLAVASAALVVSNRNPVGSLLFLVLCFFCLAGLFATLEAHFLAAIQILVYAGAILVLFLFVIMLLNLGGEDPWMRLTRPGALLLSAAGAAGFLVVLFLAFRGAGVGDPVAGPEAIARDREVETAAAPPPAKASTSQEPVTDSREVVRKAAGRGAPAERDEVGIDATTGGDAGTARDAEVIALRGPGGTTERIGTALFRDFLLPFEVTSLLLLVAMVGAVMLAKRER